MENETAKDAKNAENEPRFRIRTLCSLCSLRLNPQSAIRNPQLQLIPLNSTWFHLIPLNSTWLRHPLLLHSAFSIRRPAFYTARNMTIQVAVLCDAATDYNSKLNLLGTFDTILAAQLPAQHPQCAVAIRIAFDRAEEGTHQLSMNFVNEDGQPIMPPINVPVEIVFPADATFLSRNFVVNIQQLKFEQAGLYGIDLSMDGRQLSSIPLAVKLMEPKEPA